MNELKSDKRRFSPCPRIKTSGNRIIDMGLLPPSVARILNTLAITAEESPSASILEYDSISDIKFTIS